MRKIIATISEKIIQQPLYLEKAFVSTGFFHNKSIKKRCQVVVFISLFHYLSMMYSKQQNNNPPQNFHKERNLATLTPRKG